MASGQPAPHLQQYQFAPGNPGKPRGALSIVGKTRKICEEMGFNPIEEAIRRYRDPSTPHASKDYCLGLVTDRLLPKLKALEVTTPNGESLSQVLINVVAGSQSIQPQVVAASDLPSIERSEDADLTLTSDDLVIVTPSSD